MPPARVFIVLGLVVLGTGLLLLLLERAGVRPGEWLGRLPGDVRVERGSTRIYFPWVTCLVLSALATLALWFFRR